MIRGHRRAPDNTTTPADLDWMAPAGTRSHPATRPPPNLKTGVRRELEGGFDSRPPPRRRPAPPHRSSSTNVEWNSLLRRATLDPTGTTARAHDSTPLTPNSHRSWCARKTTP